MNPEDLNPKLPPLESHQVESNLQLSADTGDPHNWAADRNGENGRGSLAKWEAWGGGGRGAAPRNFQGS